MAGFAEEGYRGATLRGIAKRAGVSLGLVQHHFGTKDGLRAACDEQVLELVRIKAAAVEDGTIGDRGTLSTLMAIAPTVQRYVGRALVDGSPRMTALLDQVMDQTEAYLTATFPDRFVAGTEHTRDAAAVMTAMSTSTMFLQALLARRMAVEAYSPTALQRIGTATFDVYESIAEMVTSPMWTALRDGVAAYSDDVAEGPHDE